MGKGIKQIDFVAQIMIFCSMLLQTLQISSAQAAVQQCSGRSMGTDCLGMRWYSTQAPASHLAQSMTSEAKHQQSSSAMHQAPDGLFGRHDRQEDWSSLQRGGMLNVFCPPMSSRWMQWSTGTLLRVLLACCLLCVYFVLLRAGY